MNRHRQFSFVAALAFAMATPAVSIAGQELIVRLEYLVRESSLIAVVNVTEVTRVDIKTGTGQTNVYIAQAVIESYAASDQTPTPTRRTIAIVGSTLPLSSAVWKPIKKGRYLAFLNREQGHYRYGMNMAFRPIDEKGNVFWYEYKSKQTPEFSKLPLEKAIERIKEIQQQIATDRANRKSK